MHAISSYRGNRHTNKHKHTRKQTGPITIHCTAKLSAQCNKYHRDIVMATLRRLKSFTKAAAMDPFMSIANHKQTYH